MGMPGRKFTGGSVSYRYGFNGKEEDDEVKGDGNQQDYGMRIYDPRLGRFLSVDPLTKDYPHYTPYSYAGNKPIKFIDLDGLEEAKNWTDYTFQDLMNWSYKPSNPLVKDGFIQQTGRAVNTNFNLLYNGWVLVTGKEPDLPSNVTPMTRLDAATNIVTQVTIGKATGKLMTPTGPAAVEKQMTQIRRPSTNVNNSETTTGNSATLAQQPINTKQSSTFLGGAKGDLYSKQNILEGNHLPTMKSITDAGLPIQYNKASAIQMLYHEHRAFISTGSSVEAVAFRQQETLLLRQGNYIGAFELNAKRIQASYGTKYNNAIEQARKHYKEQILSIWNPQQ
jgi:RHS repeat-associated protein